MPFTAAITGFQRSELFGPMLSPGSLNMNGVWPEPTTSGSVVSSPSPICSMRSMPVQKALAGTGQDDAAHVVMAPKPAPQRAARAA